MKARVITTILIAASPSSVYRYMEDLKYHTSWNPSLQKVSPIAMLQEGMEYRVTNTLFGMKTSGRVRVKKLIRPTRLDLISTTGMLEFTVSYQLAKKGTGTLLTCRTSVSTESKAFAFAKPMMHLLARRELQADLEELKLLVEKNGDQ